MAYDILFLTWLQSPSPAKLSLEVKVEHHSWNLKVTDQAAIIDELNNLKVFYTKYAYILLSVQRLQLDRVKCHHWTGLWSQAKKQPNGWETTWITGLDWPNQCSNLKASFERLWWDLQLKEIHANLKSWYINDFSSLAKSSKPIFLLNNRREHIWKRIHLTACDFFYVNDVTTVKLSRSSQPSEAI